jgi:very-short-patch-repair endonuclease
MRITYNLEKYKTLRKKLRQSMTPEEVALWQYLKNKKLGYKFRRQASIGKYIVDFYCPEKGLVIELDGSQHATDQEDYDELRTKYLNDLNIRVFRIWNSEIKENIEGVIEEINYYLKD